MKRFTFKTDKPTGRYAAFHSPTHHIKYEKRIVGAIDAERPYRVRLMVMKTDTVDDGNPNCDWMWVTMKVKASDIEHAKRLLNTPAVLHYIHSIYKLYEEGTI